MRLIQSAAQNAKQSIDMSASVSKCPTVLLKRPRACQSLAQLYSTQSPLPVSTRGFGKDNELKMYRIQVRKYETFQVGPQHWVVHSPQSPVTDQPCSIHPSQCPQECPSPLPFPSLTYGVEFKRWYTPFQLPGMQLLGRLCLTVSP